MMLRIRVCVAAVLAVLAIAAPAGAGTASPPAVYTKVIGTQGAGDPLAQLAADDGTYMDVGSKAADGKRKVVYKTTHTGLPDADPSITFTWVGQTSLKQSCDMTLAAYAWRAGRFVALVNASITEGPTDTNVSSFRSEDGSRFVNRNGKAKVKVSCRDNEPFTLKTDQVIVAS